MHELTISIEPNEKYHRVIDPLEGVRGERTDYEDWSEEEQEAADAYIETVEAAPTTEELDKDEEDIKTLSWEDISPASDPDLISKVATYFDGMHADEPADRLRAKCRLLDVEVYVNAQIAARSELRAD